MTIEKRKYVSKVLKIIKKKGGKILNLNEFTARIKCKLECKEGHTWEANYANILSGSWCRKCFYKNRVYIKKRKYKPRVTKNQLEDMLKFADEHGIICYATKYINAKTLYKWECEKGHILYKSWLYVKQRKGLSCVDCFKLRQNSKNLNIVIKPLSPTIYELPITFFEKMKAFAKSKNGELLSTKFIDQDAIYKWKCGRDHIFTSTFLNAKHYWCSKCRLLEKRHYSTPIIITVPKDTITSVEACKITSCKPARQYWLEFFIDHKWELRMVNYNLVYEGIIKLEEILYKKKIFRGNSVVVGTVLYLKSPLSKIIIGSILPITPASIRNLLKIVKLKKE